MKRIFSFDSSPDAYTADAAVVCCFDERIRRVTAEFLKDKGILRPDMVIVAGGAKTLASPRNDFERDFILEQIRLSIHLHKADRVLVMSHSDCATYGGLAAFNGDAQVESAHHKKELQRVVQLLHSRFPEVSVEPYFIKFDGIWELLQAEDFPAGQPR